MEPCSTYQLKRWVEENKHLFSPPYKTNRVLVHDRDLLVMILHGPNRRLDFHVEPGDEFFYQIEGDIELHLKPTDQKRQVVRIREGDVFYAPAAWPTHRGAGRIRGGS